MSHKTQPGHVFVTQHVITSPISKLLIQQTLKPTTFIINGCSKQRLTTLNILSFLERALPTNKKLASAEALMIL